MFGDPIADRALKELESLSVAEEKSRLVLTENAGNMKIGHARVLRSARRPLLI